MRITALITPTAALLAVSLLAAPFLTALVLSTPLARAAAAPTNSAPANPVVVELFTSQGCNSCPPADALLQKLTERPDVLALGFHVDYWDYLGWADTLALHAATTRQHAYSKALGQGYLYTPEMIIAGRTAVVGSDDGAVERAIAKAEAARSRIELRAGRDARGHAWVEVPAAVDQRPADLWLIGYEAMAKVPIKSGENAGHTIAYADAVRSIQSLGRWSGEKVKIEIPPTALKDNLHWAVLLQAETEGPILAAVRLPAQ